MCHCLCCYFQLSIRLRVPSCTFAAHPMHPLPFCPACKLQQSQTHCRSKSQPAEAIASAQPKKKTESSVEQFRVEQCKAMQSSTMQSRVQSRHLGWHYACLPLTAPSRQGCKLGLRFSDGCNWKCLKLHSARFYYSLLFCATAAVQDRFYSLLFCARAVQDRFLFVRLCVRKKTFLGKSRFLPFWHFFALDQTTWHLCPAGFLPSRIIKQDQRHLQTRCISE